MVSHEDILNLRMRRRWVVLSIILLGFLLRIYHLRELAGFDYDAETAAWWIKSLIVDHKVSLIGQEISLGGIYAAPFYYFFLAPFFLVFRMDPIAENAAVSCLAVVTMLMVFIIGQKLFDYRVGLVSLCIYAISLQINSYDRTTSPSNPIMLVSLLVLFVILQAKQNWKHFLALGSLFGLSFSFIPTAPTLLATSGIYFGLAKRKIDWSRLVLVMFGVLIFVWPLLVFDARHDYLVSKRIKTLFFAGTAGANFLASMVLQLFTNFLTLSKIFIHLVIPFPNIDLSLFAMPLFILFVFWSLRNSNRLVFASWVGTLFIILSLYPFHVPEYYFLPVVPVLVIFLAAGAVSKLPLKILGMLLFIFSATNTYFVLVNFNLGSLYYKERVIDYIVTQSRGLPFQVDYNVDFGQKNGFDYLFYVRGREPVQYEGSRYIIVIPPSRTSDPGQEFGSIKILNRNE